MNNETRTLWISVGAGLFGMFLVYSFLQEQKAEIVKPYGGMMNVVVAVKKINELQTIDDSMIQVVQKPQSFVEPEAVKNPEDIIGHVAVATIMPDEQILFTKLLQPGPETGISLQIQPGKRAITLPVTEYTGVARLIKPGDRLDIIAAVDVGKGINLKREVATIMHDVPVLATGINVVNNMPRTFEADANANRVNQVNLTTDTKYASVTLEVTPKEGQDLIYLQTAGGGNIYFALKNPNDRLTHTRMPTSTAESILGRSFEAPAPQVQMQAAPMPASVPVPQRVAPKPIKKGYRPL
jgi:pilus assembly protein CpaB